MTVGLLSFFRPTTYEGFVATGGRITDAGTASFNQAMSRSQHVAKEALTSIKLILPNFYTALPDAGMGAAATVTASIEYPSGTIASQVKFSGATSASIANISTVTSDYATVSIPNGATFWVRVYYTNPNGVTYLGGQIPTSTEQFAWAVSGLTDQTMSGAAISGGTSAANILPPLAIIGHTVNPSVLVVGDSRSTVANGDIVQGMIAPALAAANVPYVSIAYFSARAYQWIAQATARNVLLPYGSQLINALGINDLTDSQTPAQIVASLQAINALSSAKYKYNTTLPPYTTDSGTPAASWTTTGQQTPVVTPSTFNDLVRAGFAGQSAYYEIADVVMSARNSDKWIVTPSPPYTADGLHANAAGISLITASGVIVPASYP